jgi:hypothetical protein
MGVALSFTLPFMAERTAREAEEGENLWSGDGLTLTVLVRVFFPVPHHAGLTIPLQSFLDSHALGRVECVCGYFHRPFRCHSELLTAGKQMHQRRKRLKVAADGAQQNEDPPKFSTGLSLPEMAARQLCYDRVCI